MTSFLQGRCRKAMHRVLVGAATSIIFVATNTYLSQQMYACRNKTFVATILCLLWQNIFVMTKCLSWQIFVTTNMFVAKKKIFRHLFIFSRQAYFSRDKTRFTGTHYLSRLFAATNMYLSWQKFCHNKIMFVMTNICCDKSFVMTKICCILVVTKDKHLSAWQKW